MSVTDCDATEQAPRRTSLQRFEALEKANAIRSYRAELKRDVKGGSRSIVDVLADPVPEVASMKVLELLIAMPKVGRVKAHKTLTQARVSPSKTLGGITARQRVELLALLPGGRAHARRIAEQLRERM